MIGQRKKISVKEVRVGEFFVKWYMVREIIEDLEWDIGYYTYILDSGEPRDPYRGRCSKQYITQWAERKATPAEISKMKLRQARIWERNSSEKMAAEILEATPYEKILDEIQLRSTVKHNVFVSYSHEDGNYVHFLVQALERNLIKPWIDDRIDYGTQWPRVLQEKIDECPVFIIVMSSKAYQSIWVQNELSYALKKGKRIIPLLLEGEVWLSLSATQYVDVRNEILPSNSFFSSIKKALADHARITEGE